MSSVSEDMSKLEQEAQELVTKLGELNNQIGSYKEARDSLLETNQRLNLLVETTKNLAGESHAIISKFNEISGAGFIESVEEVNRKIVALWQTIENKIDDLGEQVNLSISGINKKILWMSLIIATGIVVAIGLQIAHMFFIK